MKSKEAPQLPPPPTRNDAENDVPPHRRVSVSYGITKEWRGFYTDTDTEDTLEMKARRGLGIVDSWRRASFWADHEGVRITMTNSPKHVPLRYYLPNDTEMHEVMIGMNETPITFRIKIGKKDNYHVLDPNGQEFPDDDNLFTYSTQDNARPVNVIHGLNAGTGKKRILSTLKDNPKRIEVRFEDRKFLSAKGPRKTYTAVFEEAREAEGLPET
jgi:hypothetical protein